MSLTIESAASVEALEALRPEWAALWSADPSASPFGHPAWLIPWARTHASDRTRAVVLREDGRVAGLLPWFTWEGAALLAGTGPSDYGEALFARAELAGPALAALAAVAGGPVDLQQLRPGSPLAEAPAPPGWTDASKAGDPCPVAPIAGPEGVDAMPGKWRRKLGYTRRRAADQGGWISERATAETLEEIADALLRLHAQRWASRGGTGVFDEDHTVRHLRQTLPELHDAGLLRLHALRHAGGVAAVVFALEGKGALHFYISGFDPALTDLGPGTLLLGDIFAEAAREGIREADFLRGQERYKYHWGAEDRPTVRRRLTPPVG